MHTPDRAAALAAVRTRLSSNQDGVLETLAEENGLTLREVVDCLPAEAAIRVDGSAFLDVMAEIGTWGPVTLLVHTADVIFEYRGPIPPGTVGRGYYNLPGRGPLGGHLRHSHCTDIYFVSRPFMGHATHAVLFFSGAGQAMFKVYLGRDEKRRLLEPQVACYHALRARLCGGTGRDAPAA